MPSITFLGAARTVTGSKYLLDTGSAKVLVDAGLFQGQKELRERNWVELPLDVSSLAAGVLTHAHVDGGKRLQVYRDHDVVSVKRERDRCRAPGLRCTCGHSRPDARFT